jgi:hypothetical protein
MSGLPPSIFGNFGELSKPEKFLADASPIAKDYLLKLGVFHLEDLPDNTPTDPQRIQIKVEIKDIEFLHITPILETEFPPNYYHQSKFSQNRHHDTQNLRRPNLVGKQIPYKGIGLLTKIFDQKYIIQLSENSGILYTDIFIFGENAAFFQIFNRDRFNLDHSNRFGGLVTQFCQILRHSGKSQINNAFYCARCITENETEESISFHRLLNALRIVASANEIHLSDLKIRDENLFALLNQEN